MLAGPLVTESHEQGELLESSDLCRANQHPSLGGNSLEGSETRTYQPFG